MTNPSPTCFHTIAAVAPVLPVLSTVQGESEELKSCSDTTGGVAVPEACNAIMLPLHTDVTDGVSTGVNGIVFITTEAVAAQPLTVYEISALPAATPNTLPTPFTVAMVVLALLHAPSGVASVRVVEVPGQALVVPVIAAGTGFTVIVIVFEVTAPGMIQVALLVIVHHTLLPVARLLFEYVLPEPTLILFKNQV